MPDLLIRDLERTTHDELKRRARNSGLSLQAYVTRLLERSTRTPPLEDWLRDLGTEPRHPEVSGSEALDAARAELP